MGDFLQSGKIIYQEGLKRTQRLKTGRAPSAWERDATPAKKLEMKTELRTTNEDAHSLRKIKVNVALTSMQHRDTERDRTRWEVGLMRIGTLRQ